MASTSLPPAPTAEQVAAHEQLVQKVTRWQEVRAEAKRLAAEEASLRLELFAQVFPSAPERGTHRHLLGWGKDLRATTRLNYTVDREALLALEDRVPADVAGRVFRYEPRVVEAEYLAVEDPVIRELLASVITARPGTPQLEIVDAK